MFKHNEIPHELWIDQNGYVKAITGHEEVTAENITAVIEKKDVQLALKKDVEKRKYSFDQPVFSGKQNIKIPAENLLYNSMMTRYRDDLQAGIFFRKSSITCLNISIQKLYQLAYGEFKASFSPTNRTILEINDSAKVNFWGGQNVSEFDKWKWDNLYCYELNLGDTLVPDKMFEIMRSDLDKYFGGVLGLKAERSKRKVTCWILTRTSSSDRLKTSGEPSVQASDAFTYTLINGKLIDFVSALQSYYFQMSSIPLIDETHYTGKIDLNVNCDLTNMAALNDELSKYDLKFIQGKRDIDMIVIREVSADVSRK
jgi:hypothetical protein